MGRNSFWKRICEARGKVISNIFESEDTLVTDSHKKFRRRNLGLKLILVILIIIAVIMGISTKDTVKKNIVDVSSSELARAMTYARVADGDEATNSEYVNFDAFFLRDLDGDGYAEGVRGTCRQIGNQDTLYMELNVFNNGKLENGVITVNSDNFYLQTVLPKDNEIKNNVIGENIEKIELNTINNGTQKFLTGVVKSGDYSYESRKTAAIGKDTSRYSRINSITLTGTHVADDGTRTEVSKTIEFNVDWYGTVNVNLPDYFDGKYYKNQKQNIETIFDEENGEINLEFDVLTTETKNELELSKSEIELDIPDLNGYKPSRVEVGGTNVIYTYDSETKKVVAERSAQTDENGNIIQNAYTNIYSTTSRYERYNIFNVKVAYPYEAYESIGSDTIEIKIPISAYNEGFNNKNTEFNNPYKSSIVKDTISVTYRKLEGTAGRFDVTVGKYYSKPIYGYFVSKKKPLNIYNETAETEENDLYTVRWYGYTGTSGESSGMIMKETKTGSAQNQDKFVKNDSTEVSMEDVTTNVGIAFSGATSLLGEDGEIKVYDDVNDNLLVTFNKDNWGKYTESNPYRYEVPVKHIRVETSQTNKESSFTVYNIKELDDEYITSNYSREEFDNLKYIKSTLVGYLNGAYFMTDTHSANYIAPLSIVNLSMTPSAISTQTTEKNVKIEIAPEIDESYDKEKWLNGSFLLKLPSEIIDLEINNITSNNSLVKILSYEVLVQDGNRFIKILTSNDTPTSFVINLDVNITPDPRIATVSRNVELYAINENCENYYTSEADLYDLDGDGNINEKVGKASYSISLVSPNSLLTNQVANSYDNSGSIAIAPQIAIVEKDQREANIDIEIKNNYSNTISEVQVLGRVPTAGNKYAINGDDLGSNFTATMKSGGIQIPEEIAGYVKIYYSEKIDSTKDLNDSQNGWTETPSDWSKVRSYLIDLENYVMPYLAVHKFSYKIEIPAGLNYNQVSYSHHGVYFSLDTDEGKYRTNTEPNKLGFMIAKQFDLEVVKYQSETDRKIQDATYSLIEDGLEEGKTRVTSVEGKLVFNNIYAERTYILKEVKSPKQYELNENEVKFTTVVNSSGILEANLVSGNLRAGTNLEVQKSGEGYKILVQVEDNVKPNIKITKTEQGNTNKIQGVKYKLTGKGLPTNGRLITTNVNGEIVVNGLYLDEEYTLEETKAEGYYLASPIKFVIRNNDGEYSVEISEGIVKSQNTNFTNDIPTIELNIENEKIPTYDLELTKIQKRANAEISDTENVIGSTEETVYLAGAKFKLIREGKELGEYISDDNGKIVINNLYQYVDGKDFDAIYTLKEVLAPEGYAKVKDIVFKVEEKDGILVFEEELVDGQSEKKYNINGNTVKVEVEDNPSFKLIKKDGETGQVLANIKFAIYNIDNGDVPATDSKGNTIGTKEIINGREYNVVVTNARGEITADLPEGLYKAVEVEAPEKYEYENKAYYFGIGTSREAKKVMGVTDAKSIGGNVSDYITSSYNTSDGGYIEVGYSNSSEIKVGQEILYNSMPSYSCTGILAKYGINDEIEWIKNTDEVYKNGIKLFGVIEVEDGYVVCGSRNGSTNSYAYEKGIIIKYDYIGNVVWVNEINTYYAQLNTISCTEDGKILVGGYFGDIKPLNLGNYILINNSTGYGVDGIIIKYDLNGDVLFAKGIGGSKEDSVQTISETGDGGIIVGGYFESSSIDLGNGIILNNNGDTDGMIIKYGSTGEVEWAKGIGGNKEDNVQTISETGDGGIIVGGYFESSSIDLGNGIILNNNGDTDGMIIKYSPNGEAEWSKGIGGSSDDIINLVTLTSDGGYIAGGYFGSTIQVGNITLTSNGRSDGIIIKYNEIGEVEWAKGIGGSSYDYIKSVASTSDGGYIVGGYFKSNSIQVGNTTLTNSTSTVYSDGMMIKLEKIEIPSIVVKQSKGIGGRDIDKITSVASTNDGGYIVGGYFNSSSIQVGNTTLTKTNNGLYDGMIIKYSPNGEAEWSKGIGGSSDDIINSVASTNDGGYIVGGYFNSSSIQVGNTTLTSNGRSDGIIIKYDCDGEVEWAKGIGGTDNDYIRAVASTTDGGYIVGGYFNSSSIQVGNTTLTNNGSYDGIIIRYDCDGEVKWAKGIGETDDDYINFVAETNNGGYIAGGYFKSNSIQVGNTTLTNNGSSDGMIIKYDCDGEVEWSKGIGGSSAERINSVASTNDGGCIVGGYFQSSSIQIGDTTLTRNGINSYPDGMIIKYNCDGEVEWSKGIGGTINDYIDSVAETNDGGCIVGGYFNSSSIQVGNTTLTNNGSSAGMIIKYDCDGEVEWAKGIGGDRHDYINSVASTSDGGYIAGGYFKSNSIQVGNTMLTNNGNQDGMVIKLAEEMGVPDVQELEVTNNRKEFKITTDVMEIDGVKGGFISGEDLFQYEKVKYGDSSTKEIKMIPDENYEIISITVNGEEYQFNKAQDGSYTMPKFTNMNEDKHIVVTYSLKDNKITINKVDKNTKNNITGAKFKLDQIEERSTPNNSEIIGNLTDNGQEYIEYMVGEEVTGGLGNITNNGTYYFVNQDGKYVPTNSKTYQVANGGTAGVQSVTANSYIPIDLTGLTGTYLVTVNASVSSESADYGYATITENTTAPSYTSTNGKFMYISGTKSSADYTSSSLEGGKVYYLHLGYRKDSSVDTNDDQVVINSVKLSKTISKIDVYNFINNNGKYESTNQGKDSTVANSYIPIDLTNYSGKYNLVVNAEVSSQSSDYGYATITENTTRPSYSTSTGRFIYISGTKEAVDYSTVLQGGKIYYLHLGYYKNASTSSGDDKFTVNSIKVTLNDSELYHTEVETNSAGQAITQIPFGKYKLTETNVPDGYYGLENPMEIEFRANGVHEFTVENEPKAKVLVHHYIKGTTTKVAEDELLEGRNGDEYRTIPKIDLEKYVLELDINGNAIIPTNAIGKYSDSTMVVTYYYVKKSIPLTVHHYIEGTNTNVPLKNGSFAEDVVSQGYEGDSYNTTAISNSNLADDYELVEVPVNASGIFGTDEVIVTYYYKKVVRDVNLIKYDIGGVIPLSGAKFSIDGKEYTSDQNGKIHVSLEAGTYSIIELEAPEGYVLYENPVTDVTITRDTTEENISITNDKKQGTVTVKYLIEGTTTPVPMQDGSVAKEELKSGYVGDIYATQEKAGISVGYELSKIPDNASGTYIDGNIEVIYYYKIVPAEVIVHHYVENTTTKLAEDVTISGKVGDSYLTTVAPNIPSKYELVAMPSNATGNMTKNTIEVIYYYTLKNTSVLVHHYKEGTTESLSQDVTINGKIDSSYTTNVATDIPSKYELVAIPENSSGTMSESQIVITYYYRLKETGVIVHYYKEGTTESLSQDITISGKVDDKYTTKAATDIPSKYELVAVPENSNGTMTENQIVVIYYYRLKDTSVLVHHYIENTTTKLSDDVVIDGQVDDSYTTTQARDIDEKYELLVEPENKDGIMTEEQVIVIYYYKLKDTYVTVHHYIENTTTKLSENVRIDGKVDDEYTTVSAPDIPNKYELIAEPINKSGTMTISPIEVTYYYRLKDTSVLVHYYKEGTTESLSDDVTINGKVDDLYTTSSATDIPSKYELVSEPTNKNGTMTVNQTVVTYYYRVKDTSVLVHHYIKGSTTSLSDDVTINGKVDDLYTTSSATDIPEYYELVSEPLNKNGAMTENQIVVTYYYQLKQYGYVVNYLEKDTNIILHDQKQGLNYIYGTEIDSSTEKIAIDGYNYDSADIEILKIGTGENVINLYYTKRSDLSYKVNYLEKGSNEVLHDPKIANNQIFDSVINSKDEVIKIDGYDYDSVDKDTLTIGIGTNEINIYYTKVTGLSYTVNYLEKGSNNVLSPAKIQGNKTFNDVIVSENEIIKIDGYNYDSVDKETLTITMGENVINIYYTKRNDLSYTVNYLEKDTGKVLHTQKVVDNQMFANVINSADEIISIDGYTFDSVDRETLTITTGENVINIYYAKRTDLSYKVNYLEKDTGVVLHDQKIANNQVFGVTINSADEVITIDGYNYDSVDKVILNITTGENVINIYYTKRTDLIYKVNYLEKDTNSVLRPQKTANNQVLGTIIKSSDEVIAIDGYNYDSVDKESLNITTGENVINIYYTKKSDLSYVVNYLEKDTNNVLYGQKIVNNQVFNSTINSADEVIQIDGYYYDSVDKEFLMITTEENVINIYYTKRSDLSYKVNYLEKNTNRLLHSQKIANGQIFGSTITSRNEVLHINGYSFDSVDKETLVITTGNNEITIYYTKLTNLSYVVNYLEKDTGSVLHFPKTEENQVFETEIDSSREIIPIDGYNYDSVDKDKLVIGTGENVINIYYTKKNDLTYKVNYLEKGINVVLHDQKTVNNQVFKTVINSSNEVISIDGYVYDSVDKDSLEITTGENVINIYYVKRADLSYVVNYLEKDTNVVLHDQRTVNNQVFKTIINSSNEVIPIDGYVYDSVDKENLEITTGENVINIYYVKRADLSYVVNYLEKDTNVVLHAQKTVNNQVFRTVVNSLNEVIPIDGYVYDSVDKETLEITTGENVINIYYIKRTDLSYVVNYLEKDTNVVLHDQKTVDNQVFNTEIVADTEVINIKGYNFDSIDKDVLIIGTGENVINIYYTKRTDLDYKVNYLEKDTDIVLHAQKVSNGQILDTVIDANNEVIPIDGYNFDSADNESITIGVDENVINLYYTKRTDLSYVVNYLEKDTGKVLHEQKVVNNQTFKTAIKSVDELIQINGYNYDSVDKDVLVIGTGENVINIYYTKRTDLSYKVNYLEKGTENVIHDQKVVNDVVFETVINSDNEVITLYGYDYDSVDKDSLMVGTDENVINIYYTKKDTSVLVHHYVEGTEEKLSEDVEISGKVFDLYTTNEATDIDTKWQLAYVSENKNGEMTEEQIVVIYYYRKKPTKVNVHYYEEGTTNKLSEDVVKDGRVDDYYETEAATDIPAKYELVGEPENKNGTMTEEEINVIYYYRVRDAYLNIYYLEKGTDRELAEPEQQKGKVDEDYITEAKDIEGYTLVEHSGNEKGRLTIEPQTVTYYYLYNAKATVQYIDKNTGEILEERTDDGLEGDDFVTESKDFENYVLVEEPEEKTVKMTKEEIVLKYYYAHISAGVIEKHIDKISGKILYNETHEGNEGDEYNILSREFESYELVEEELPDNASGQMTIEPIEVKYYYIYKTTIVSEYIDMITGEKIETDEQISGLENEPYETKRKPIDNYILVGIPENADGNMTKDEIKVTYYYARISGGVIVNHLDIKTNKQLRDEVKEEGYEGKEYETHEENIDKYDLVQEKYPENAKGKMTVEPTRVDYYYIKKTSIVVKYVDKNTGEEIADKEERNGHEGDPYTTEEKEVDGYDLLEDPENKDGEMGPEPTEIIYYYVRPAKVIVNHYDIETKEKLADEEIINGHEGDEYKTEEKDIKYYKLTEKPENAQGKMRVEGKWVDAVTNPEEGDSETPVNDNEDKSKDLVNDGEEEKTPVNDENEEKESEMSDAPESDEDDEESKTPINGEDEVDDDSQVLLKPENSTTKKIYIIDDTIYVDYYYRKKEFNLKIEKEIAEITNNGQVISVNSDIGKVEINKNKVSSSNILVKYRIIVTNDSELLGKGKIEENIPNGMIMDPDSNTGWNFKAGGATIETKELKPGESVAYDVVLVWISGNDNVGMKENIAEIITTENEAGYEEIDDKDNQDRATVVLSIGTGTVDNDYTLLNIITVVVLMILAIRVGLMIKKEK